MHLSTMILPLFVFLQCVNESDIAFVSKNIEWFQRQAVYDPTLLRVNFKSFIRKSL